MLCYTYLENILFGKALKDKEFRAKNDLAQVKIIVVSGHEVILKPEVVFFSISVLVKSRNIILE
jgi:hypothetical protein